MLPSFSTLSLELNDHVAHLQLNRPRQANAINQPMWQELGDAMIWANETAEVRVVVLSGAGNYFCSGIDLSMLSELTGDLVEGSRCEGRKREALREKIIWLQGQLTKIERCRKPVLAAVHGLCIGGGVDLITACDMRYCTEDAQFSVKEIDVGLVADIGTLQRLPQLIGDGMMRELVYTGRSIKGSEATTLGLTNRCFSNKETMMEAVFVIANTITSKSPLTVRGSKQVMLYSRDHSIADGLDYVATWNAGMLLSEDIKIALNAHSKKEQPQFEN